MWTPKGTTRGNSDTNDGQAAGHEGPKNQNKEEQDLSDVERVEVESKPGEGSLYQWYFTELVNKVHEQQRRTLNASASDFYQGGPPGDGSGQGMQAGGQYLQRGCAGGGKNHMYGSPHAVSALGANEPPGGK